MTRSALLRAALLVALSACGEAPPPTPWGEPLGAPPAPAAELTALVGEYVAGPDTLSVLERDGALWVRPWGEGTEASALDPDGALTLEGGLIVGGRTFDRLELGGVEGGTFRITPLRPPAQLLEDALAARPPVEDGGVLAPDLVELVTLDPSIRLDVRYATTNNFMGEVFYSQPRAFLQRPAAEALVQAHQWLSERGYGVLVHDGYRPWYVTKMFWDATPEAMRAFVADPSQGSRHNRGCAVDRTLYHLATGEVVEMPGGYDEFSPRSFPDYAGGTTRQRWHRDLLRQAMEAAGFAVYENEWWHFDYADWRLYPIGNQRFEELDRD